MNAILCVAQKELKDGFRNRWIVAITLIFAILASGIAWFGAVASGVIGFTSIPNTIASLASLAVFIIPLIALLLAYNAIVGEDEEGTLMLLLTYPLSRAELLMGKLLGHTLILAISTVVGFGISALMIMLFAAGVDTLALVKAFSLFISSSIILGMVFLSIAYLISASVAEKSKAAGIALIVWFFFVLVFDLGLLGLLVFTAGKLQPDALPYLMLLNPTDLFRLINMMGFEGGTSLMSIATDLKLSYSALFAIMLLWVVVPFGGAYLILRRRIV